MKSALITGVCGGIGSAIAARLLRGGWIVYGVDLPHLRDSAPLGVQFRGMDVSESVSRKDAIDSLVGLRHLSALINVAAIQLPREFSATDEFLWEQVLRTNLIAPAELARLLLPNLKRANGSIVNIASVHAHATSPGVVPYATSKAALVGLTRALAVELGREGIRVNAVLPGAIETPMLAEGLLRSENPEAARQALRVSAPMGRIGEPGDIAELVAFLVEEKSGFITGQEFIIDGGVLAVLPSESSQRPADRLAGTPFSDK